MNLEFEISFKVNNIIGFYNYFESNGYILKEESNQRRVLYKKEDKTMARITIKNINGMIT